MSSFFSKLLGQRGKMHPGCSVVVAAAGSSTRMEGQDKILALLDGEPVLCHTLRALECSAMVQEIVVVTRADLIVPISQLCRDYQFSKVSKVIVGGETRTQSVLAGVQEVRSDAELIAIHDGARPFLSQEVLEEVLRQGQICGAAAPAIPVKDTLKLAHGGLVEDTPDRSALFAVQTPQVFEASLIKAALTKAVEEGISLTDDCAAVERLGMTVVLTKGSEANLKITTPLDLFIGEAILNGQSD